MQSTGDSSNRRDPRKAVQRDRARMGRREKDSRGFWRSLSVIGMVGWPIALGAVGGAWLGHWLDGGRGSGVRYTLILMTLGLMLGCLAAWNTVTQKHD